MIIKNSNKKCNHFFPIVTMGTFDGVHLGHKKLIAELIKQKELHSGETVVLTYYHHPLETLNQIVHPYLLTEKSLKEEFLNRLGIDCVYYLQFSKEMAQMSAEEFLEKILIKKLKAKIIVAGYDTHFGKNRSGSYELLKKYETKYKYKAIKVEPHYVNGKLVSSSMIRDLIKQGKLEEVKDYLGRHYMIYGKVVHGKQLGRTFGFPTINMQPEDEHKLVPQTGIYLTAVYIKQNLYFGLTNVGYSPTIKLNQPLEIETFILDFNQNVYSENYNLIFLKRIRDEKKFSSKNELIENIKNDVKIGKELLKNYDKKQILKESLIHA